MGPPRDPVAAEPSDCPSKFQDPAELEPLEAEAAFVSKVATRAARLLTICSTLAILVVRAVAVWESVWTQFSIVDAFCKKSGSCRQISLIFSSIVLGRLPVLSVKTRTVWRPNIRRSGWKKRYRQCLFHR